MNWQRTTAPTLKPLTLAELRAQCQIPDDLTDQDTLLLALGDAAVGEYEKYAGRGALTQSWTVSFDDWFQELWLPMAAPLQSITSVKYRAADGTLTTLSASYYVTDVFSEPGRIMRAPNMVWPALQSDRLARVQIEYVVGWTAANLVPQNVKQGLLLLVSHWFAERQAVNVGNIVSTIPYGVESLWGDRVWMRPMVCA